MISDSRYGCAAARNSDTCTNRKTIQRYAVEALVLSGLKDELVYPDRIAEFIAEFERESQKERLESLAARSDADHRLTKVTREIDANVTTITEGMYHPSIKAKMDGLEAERAELAGRLEALPAFDPVPIHPGIADIYASKVADLAAALNEDGTRAETADLLRGLIDKM